jgi:hypothetical protein
MLVPQEGFYSMELVGWLVGWLFCPFCVVKMKTKCSSKPL